MSTMIPGPDTAEAAKTGNQEAQGNNNSGTADDDRSQRHEHSKKTGIPSENDCLRAIAQMAGLVALGLLEPAQANSARASFRELLAHYRGRAREAEKGLSNANVMDVLRQDPKLLDLLAPLLTSEQIDMVMNATNEGADG